MNMLIGLIALIAEPLLGYPALLQRRIGHPVQWMGALIDLFDRHMNDEAAAAKIRRRAGIIMLAALCTITALLTLAISLLLHRLPFGWVAEALLASVFLAHRQLGQAVRAVADGLEASLLRGREAVSHIVGRDTKALEEEEVARAAIETLAENASDGVIAPLFWLLIFGLPGIAVYKAINTADSMVGHLNARYADFGWASAKTDDVVNWVPARLTAILFCLAAIITPGASARAALKAVLHDAGKHKSPNAGWPEAAMAGALHFGLGGPRAYGGEVLNLPSMGTGRRHLGPNDIRKSITLYAVALMITFIIVVVLYFSII